MAYYIPLIQRAPLHGPTIRYTARFGLARFPVPLPCVHDTWYPNGNNKKPNFGGYSNKFYISCVDT